MAESEDLRNTVSLRCKRGTGVSGKDRLWGCGYKEAFNKTGLWLSLEIERIQLDCDAHEEGDRYEKMKMQIAKIHDFEAGQRFFDEYDIPYEVISRGKNKGKLKVKPIRSSDCRKLLEARNRLKAWGMEYICDHANVFRDREDNTVVTFSPYGVEEVPNGIDWIEMSDISIYGLYTKTFVLYVE